jgi:hypothetical protein
MHTEPTPVGSLKRPPLPETSELPPTAEELENVTIRVVRLDQLAPTRPEPPTQSAAPRSGTQRMPVEQGSVPAPSARAPQIPQAAAPPVSRPASAGPASSAVAAPEVKPLLPTAPPQVARAPAAPAARPAEAPAARPAEAPAARPAEAPAARPAEAPAARPAEAPAARPAEAPAARDTPAHRTPAAVARPSVRPDAVKRSRRVSWSRVGYLALVVALYLGWSMPTERYMTPTRGFGYALGIIGGSLMLVLLLYSARKHFTWLRCLGPTPAWFRFHMVLGILGPVCILFHSNFRTGAANSNVALFCMLTVAGSGFIGRYLYAHIHSGLYGRKLQLGELQAKASGLRELSGSVSFMPDLVARLETAEQRLLVSGPRLSLLGFLKPAVVACAAAKTRWQLHRYVRRGLRASARKSTVIAAESKRLRRAADGYIDRRLAATRRVAEFEGYERLFSLWHALHIPLIFMLIIAAVVHVIAVNVY